MFSKIYSVSIPVLRIGNTDLNQIKTLAFKKVKVKMKSLSRVQLFATPLTVAYQAPLSMGFSRQECWSGLPFPSPGDLPDPGIESGSPALQADALSSEPPGKSLGTVNLQLQSPFVPMYLWPVLRLAASSVVGRVVIT